MKLSSTTRDAADSILDEAHLWEDEDFEEEEEEEVDEVEQEIEEKAEEGAEKARYVARWEAKKEIEARERGRERYEEEEEMKLYVQQHPEYMLVRVQGRLSVVLRPAPQAPPSVGTAALARPELNRSECAGERQLPKTAELPSTPLPGPALPIPTPSTEQPEKKPAANSSAAAVREKINSMIRENLPQLTKAYNEALQKEGGKQHLRKQPQKEALSTAAKKKAT